MFLIYDCFKRKHFWLVDKVKGGKLCWRLKGKKEREIDDGNKIIKYAYNHPLAY